VAGGVGLGGKRASQNNGKMIGGDYSALSLAMRLFTSNIRLTREERGNFLQGKKSTCKTGRGINKTETKKRQSFLNTRCIRQMKYVRKRKLQSKKKIRVIWTWHTLARTEGGGVMGDKASGVTCREAEATEAAGTGRMQEVIKFTNELLEENKRGGTLLHKESRAVKKLRRSKITTRARSHHMDLLFLHSEEPKRC